MASINAGNRVALDDLVACRSCDALYNKVDLEFGEATTCQRCDNVLQTRKPNTVDRAIAATLAVLVLMVMALCLPFLGLSRAGIESHISILDASIELWREGFVWLGVSAMMFLVALPLARFALLAYALLSLRLGLFIGATHRRAFRWAEALGPWAMIDIFLVGAATSLVKISTMARLDVGLAFWALLGAIALSVYTESVLCRDTVWEAMQPR